MKRAFVFTRSLYLLLTILLFYLLLTSRSEEVRTVWEYMHPAFIPMYFATTALLVAIVFTDENPEANLILIIIHALLSHSFFIIIFPAGNIGFQQSILGRTRRVFDNISPHGYGGTVENPLMRIYNWFGGANLQSTYSVTFARMFGIDVFWAHLLLMPLLWGIFLPTITFLIAKTLGGNDTISALAALLGSAFPFLIYLGAVSIPNSLGIIFFLGTLLFSLRYLTAPDPKYTYLLLVFAFAAFLAHFLTGLISLAFLLLAFSLRKYKTEKINSPMAARILLVSSFLIATSILPIALVYHGIFSPRTTYFTLDKIYEYPTTELLGQLVLGDYLYYDPRAILIYIAGPLIAFIWILYNLYTIRNRKTSSHTSIQILFLLFGFLLLGIDYRILNIFMTNVPFNAERTWMFRDLLSTPLLALAINNLLAFGLRTSSTGESPTSRQSFLRTFSEKAKKSAKASINASATSFLMMSVLIPAVLAGWITLSVSFAYPNYSPLQTTTYELEAINHIEETTNQDYIVICDFWTAYAGQMRMGIQNPAAYYFAENDPVGAAFYIKMRNDPSPEVMIEAMNYTDAEVAYFLLTKPRVGTEEYNRITQQAHQNDLQTYSAFYHKGEEKLHIFRYSA